MSASFDTTTARKRNYGRNDMSGILTLGYGVVSYLIFFLTFLYAIGFLETWSSRNPSIHRRPIRGRRRFQSIWAAGDLCAPAQRDGQASIQAVADQIHPLPRSRGALSCLPAASRSLLLFWQWRPLGGVVWDVQHEPGRALLYGGFAFGWALVLTRRFSSTTSTCSDCVRRGERLRGEPQAGLAFETPFSIASSGTRSMSAGSSRSGAHRR